MPSTPAPQPTQLTLGIRLDDRARFENFYPGAANRTLLQALGANSPAAASLAAMPPVSVTSAKMKRTGQTKAASLAAMPPVSVSASSASASHPAPVPPASAIPTEPYLYLFGAPGCGRTHLLQALCHQASRAGQPSLYLPLAERHQFTPDILTGVHQLNLVAMDDLHLIATDASWEGALFTAFNRLKESGSCLVVTAPMPPRDLPLHLPDLKSRLNSGLSFQIQSLTDAEKCAMLTLRAQQRGIKLPAEVANYILRHANREMRALMQTLDKLDANSLIHQRKLSIPLVKATLAE